MKHVWIPILVIILIAAGCATVVVPQQGSITAPPTTQPKQESVAPTLEPTPPSDTLAGVVRDAEGPVAGAIVRVQATDNKTTTDDDGSFTLSGLTTTVPVTVTAAAEGYFFGWATGTIAGQDSITITVEPHYTTDNREYEWAAASEICSECHGPAAYPEWKVDAHSQSAVNPRFLSMYEGTDVHGNESPLTGYSYGFPKAPDDFSQPYYGPGYKIDYPNRAGNCAACHTPLASSAPQYTCSWLGCHTDETALKAEQAFSQEHRHQLEGINPTGLTGSAAEGISCDFCHKIGDVNLDPATGLPHTDKPGILSMRLYRPDDEQQLFFGPLDDVAAEVDSYLPFQEQSAFCAPCHYGVFSAVDGKYGGVVVYNSFGEWLESPYSDPETGRTCQDCHMPTVDYEYFVYPEKGGLRRDPNRIHNHTMPGASNETLLRNSVTMTTTAQLEGDEVLVEVGITNDKAGHHVPTDSPLRHVILIVQATDAGGNSLPLQDGPVLPEWTGNYASQPGRYYAKILEDKYTGESPTSSYWRDISLVEDTRLAAFASDVSQYTFAAPVEGAVTVEAHLIFRRAFQRLMEWKDWDTPDIVMEEETIKMRP
ncbi:MAG: hypothetical protein MAG451_02834 [Anaerolineales bacterium]|nr:hypothetical protein [Anaerolineales bacterium]